MQSSPPDKRYLLYIWFPEARKEQLRAPLDLFLARLSPHLHQIVFVSSDLMNTILPVNSDNHLAINTNTARELYKSGKNYKLYPLCACNIKSFEEKCEDFFTLLQKPWAYSDSSQLDITSENEINILSSSHHDLLLEKEADLGFIYTKCKSIVEDRPSHLRRHVEIARELLDQNLSLPTFFFTSETKIVGDVIFNERMKQLLSVQVELAYFMHSDIDPVDGWLEYFIKEDSYEVRNPFMSISMNGNMYGALNRIEYLPRKFLLNDGFSSLYSSLYYTDSELKTKLQPSEPFENYRIMRKQPDLFAIRFDEPLAAQGDQNLPICCKVLYFKSGLGSFMPNSTTGFTLEYWLENSDHVTDTSDFWLHFPLLFPGSPEAIHLRALTPLGGEDEKLNTLAETTKNLHGSEVPGGLYGIRLINSATHFIIDLRFARNLESISFGKTGEGFENTLINLSFRHKISSLNDYERLQSMYFCIY